MREIESAYLNARVCARPIAQARARESCWSGGVRRVAELILVGVQLVAGLAGWEGLP
jgi:hypothetical protein